MWTALKECRRRRASARLARKLRKCRFEALRTRSVLAGLFNGPRVPAVGPRDDGNSPRGRQEKTW
jgi:hypothetical protein